MIKALPECLAARHTCCFKPRPHQPFSRLARRASVLCIVGHATKDCASIVGIVRRVCGILALESIFPTYRAIHLLNDPPVILRSCSKVGLSGALPYDCHRTSCCTMTTMQACLNSQGSRATVFLTSRFHELGNMRKRRGAHHSRRQREVETVLLAGPSSRI